MTNVKTDWYSIRADYKPIAPELRSSRGEWCLQAILIHEFRDRSGAMQAEKTPLGSIDFDRIDSVEVRQAFYAATEKALDALKLPHEARNEIAAELRLIVQLPGEPTAKRPRIGLGAVLPDKKP